MTDLQDTTVGSFVIKTEKHCEGIFYAPAVCNLPVASDIEHERQTCWHLAVQAVCYIQGRWDRQSSSAYYSNMQYTRSLHCKVNNLKCSL